jgi:hypothetical protein|tara:strand:+ start:3418 stop:4089 length:672 start_codon:yes stop_codon:yes gene_type:complete
MKISNKTLDILKNFSEINQSILIKAGKQLKTVSTLKNILAHAEVEEDFPQDFAIYQLNEFIGVLSTMSNPELSFNDKYVLLSQDKAGSKYFFADPSVVVSPEKDITMPSEDVTFHLSEKHLSDVMKMASILQLNDIMVKGCDKSGKIFLAVTNKKNDTSNDYSVQVGEGVASPFKMYFKTENLKMVGGDYDVFISEKGISHFKSKTSNLEYWIALEPDSKYGA